MSGEAKSGASRFDPNFTQHVIDAMGPKTSPRMREVMTSLTRHLHDFAREIELTVDEWMEGVKLLDRAGQMSNEKRNEGQLVCDVVGLESSSYLNPLLLILNIIGWSTRLPTRKRPKQLV